MRELVSDRLSPRRIERMIRLMSGDQKRVVFGLPFEQWNASDWLDLFKELPSGFEFAA